MDLQLPPEQPITVVQKEKTSTKQTTPTTEFLAHAALFLQMSAAELKNFDCRTEIHEQGNNKRIKILKEMQKSIQQLKQQVNVLEAQRTVDKENLKTQINTLQTDHTQSTQELKTQTKQLKTIFAGTGITALLLLCWWYFSSSFHSS